MKKNTILNKCVLFLFDSENKTKKSEVLNNITAKVQVLLLFSKI